MYIYTYYARNRTHVCLRGGAAACAPIPISRTSTRMATAASSARAIARTCACEAVQPHARPY